MSFNLHLSATVTCIIKGKPKKLYEKFDLFQTPTKITDEILASADIKQAYYDWIKSHSEDEKIPVYANDFFGEGVPIGYKTINEGLMHIEVLEQWLKDHEDWDILWEAL